MEEFKVGDNVKLSYITDCNKHNNKVGTITWLHQYNYYPKGDLSLVELRTQGTIIYDDGTEEHINDFYRKGSGIVSPVIKVA